MFKPTLKILRLNLNKCWSGLSRRNLQEFQPPNYLQEVQTRLNKVQSQLDSLTNDPIYQGFVARIKAHDKAVSADPTWQFYLTEKQQLTKKEEDLMKEKQDLMKEKQLILKKEEQLREMKILQFKQQQNQPQAVPMEVEKSRLELFLNKFSEEIKEDFSVIDQLSNNSFKRVVDRGACLRQIANEILRRSLSLNSDEKIDRRIFDRYIGIQAAPGGGKSQMLDYIGALKGEIMDYVDVKAAYESACKALGQRIEEEIPLAMLNDKLTNLKKILNESVYIPITFNGDTPIYNEEEIYLAMAMRILYSYFIETKKLPFDSFALKLRRTGDKDSVFLLFDEIGKVKSTDKVYECLRCALKLLKNTPPSHVIITSLEVSNITISATGSGRHIHFVHLKPLSVDSSLELFTDYANYGYVKRMVLALGGSPRCLELLSRILKSNASVLYQWNYDTLFKCLFSIVAQNAIPYSRLTIEDVRPALLRTKVRMREIVKEGRTFEQSVERGMYLNSFTAEEMESGLFVPYISPFALAVFASTLLSNENEDSLQYKIGRTLYSLASFLTLEEEDLRGTPFEVAHGLWETLIRLLHQSEHPRESFNLKLKSIYPSFLSSTAFDNFYFAMPGDYFQLVHSKKQFKEMNQNQLQPNVVYHFGGSNEGFDLSCYPTAVDDTGPGVVAWNLVSTNDATTVEGMSSILRKMELALKQYEGTKYPPNQVYLVFLLKRNVAISNIPENCIVLKTEHLKACYGQSLANYMFFLD